MDNDSLSVRSLFPQVFANGFVPIPNLDKRCLLYAWPRVRVDRRQVNLWSRSRRWPAIGIRLEPPILVVDIDVLEAELAARIERMLPAGTLRRIGQAPKAAHFLRLDGEPFHRIATRRWAPDVTIEKPAWSAVEIFGAGGGGKQFGAFGPHKTDKAGKVLSRYSWPDGRSPANTRLDVLPVLSIDAVIAIVNAAEELFRERGLAVDNFTRGGLHKVDQVYDLDAGTMFKGEFADYDLDGLEAAARAAAVTPGAALRVTGSFTGDRHSGGSLRCRVGLSHWGRVYVHDFKSGLTHHPVDAAAARGARDGASDAGTFADILKLITEPSNDPNGA